MKIADLMMDFNGSMIYAAASDEVFYKIEVFRPDDDLLRMCTADSVSLSEVLLPALAYYKGVVSRSSEVLIGVFNAAGEYRPEIFRCDPSFTRRAFHDYVQEQTAIFDEIAAEELSALYRQNKIAYEPMDFTFCRDNMKRDGMVAPGLINLSLSGENVIYVYNCACVSENEIHRLHSRLMSIARDFVLDGETGLFDTDIIGQAEKDLILGAFNDTRSDAELKFLHVQLSEVAARVPDKLAAIAGDERITYRELDEKSNQLARCLREKGAKRNGFVAIAVKKGINFYIAFFGILKAGSAFMPIDVEFPEDRVRYMLDEADCRLVITDGSRHYADPDEEIDIRDAAAFAYDNSPIDNINTLSDHLFLIFTSGTTGRPKGVISPHRGWVNMMLHADEYECDGNEMIPHFGKVTFGYAYYEVLYSLTRGLTLVVPSDDEIQDTELFNRFLRKYHIDALFVTPQFYSMIDASCCKYITTAGGLASQAIAQKGADESRQRFYNMYGSTEGTIVSTYIIPHGGTAPEKVPIGKPCVNMRMYIMLNRRLCGIGTIGELCIAGNGLADGYLNNPKLTNEKFEYNENVGERIYHTGDLAMFLEDGNILHVGRVDDQIKIRGILVEVSEIENVMAKMEGVTGCVITVKKTEQNDNQLCMYFTADRTIGMKEVKDYLRRFLPEYMVPTRVMQVDVIPMTRHGKVDMRALPEITDVAEEAVKEPVTALQKAVLDIFKKVLDVGGIGIDSDFFDYGGHSLKMTELINKIDELKNVRLTVSEIFRERTAENIAALLESKAGEEAEAFKKAKEQPVYEMSPIQRRMYAIYRSNPQSLMYNEPAIVESVREIDVQRLERAFNEEIARHEIFRTTYSFENDRFVQRIADECRITIETRDSDAPLEDLLRDFVRPFVLEELPAIRVRVVRQSDRTLILTDIHHITTDRGTISKMLGELIDLYQGKTLAPVEWQYKDYSEWISHRDVSEQKDFWLRLFEDDIPQLNLPHNSKAKERSEKGSLLKFVIGEALKNQIHDFAAAHKLTDFMIMTAAFMMTLQKYSGQEDFAVGTPISARTHRNTENILGMFANTIVLRGQPEKKKTVEAFLSEIREMLLGAYQNAEYSLDDLIDERNRINGTSIRSLFDVMLVLQDSEDKFSKIGQYGLRELQASKGTTDFDLSFNLLVNADDGYDLFVEYATDWFDPSYITSMAETFERILSQIPEKFNARIEDLDVISDEDKTTVLSVFNRREEPTDAAAYRETVIDRFERQAAATPDRIAVVCGENRLTYAAFNALVNRIARTLRAAGVGPDDFVVVMANGSVEMIAALYGVLKAGGAYVPVDPHYPADRIHYILSDCKPKCIITAHASVPVAADVPVIDVSHMEGSGGDAVNPERAAAPDNLAYVIYTSGTTGNPKGVLIDHRSLHVYVDQFIRYIGVNADTVYLQQTYIGFDASIEELYPSLMTGGRIVVMPREQGIDIERMISLIETEKINMMGCVPAVANALNQSGIRYTGKLVLGGAAMYYQHVDRLIANGAEIINAYGPTEATVSVTYYRVGAACEAMRTIPIGKPTENAQIYLLNGEKLCGIGMPGELCIAGSCVSRGYLNRPELTAEKFTDNPFGGGKLYRSGDLARWLPDGNIEFMGRIDEQVKIRGFRIELGEIEETIRRQPGITDTAVIAAGDEKGESAIFAYVVSDEKVDMEALRASIGKTLPEYMIPAGIMQIDAIPLTTNGKLNRRTLPKIEMNDIRGEYVAPRTQLEKEVAEIFADVLKASRVSVNSSFYEIGGDSIKAIRVSSKLREKGYSVKVSTVMSEKTAANLAAYIEQTNETVEEFSQDEVTGEIVPMPIHDDFFGYRMANPNQFNQYWTLYGSYDADAVEKSLDALYRHHDALRIVYDQNLHIMPYSTQRFLTTIEIRERDKSQIKQIMDTVSELIQKSFDIAKNPLIKAGLFKTPFGDCLLLTIHHLAVDIVSWDILFDDFRTAYDCAVNGREIILPKKTASYQEWSRRLNAYGQSKSVRRTADYWKSVNEQVKEGQIPGDRNGEKAFRAIDIAFDEATTKRLQYDSLRAFGCEIDDILIAALTKAVHTVTGQSKTAVVMEGHGREKLDEEIDVSRTVGWFTNTRPVVTDYQEDIGSLVIGVKEAIRRTPNKGMGYGFIRRELSVVNTPDILINYAGKMEGLDQHTGNELALTAGLQFSSAPENHVGENIQLNGGIIDNVLTFNLKYNAGKYSDEWIARLGDALRNSLREVTAYCADCSGIVKTPSDYGHPEWNNSDLQRIYALYPQERIDKICSLTPMQQGLLYFKMLDEASTNYVLQNVVAVDGNVSPAVIRSAVTKVVEKYDVLRTRFVYSGMQEPMQVVLKEPDFEYREIELADDDRDELMRIAAQEVSAGLDLENRSPIRVILVLAGGRKYMIWVYHHIIIDGWCTSILFDTFLQNCRILRSGGAVNSQPDSRFAEYVRWINAQDKDDGLQYFRELLDGYENVAEIAGSGKDMTRAAGPCARELPLSRELYERLGQYCALHNVTMNTFVETVIGIVLQKYTRSNDVVFGKVVSGRNAPIDDIESAVGAFINTIPVRINAEDGETCEALIKKIEKQNIAGSSYHHIPLVDIQSVSGVGEGLIKILLAFENYYIQESDAQNEDSLTLEEISAREEQNYDITILAYFDDTLHFRVEYSNRKYFANEIDALLQRTVYILTQILAKPDMPVADVEVTTDSERTALLGTYNDTAKEYTFGSTVTEMLEKQVDATPDSRAVVFGGRSISYRELNEHANRVAHRLRSMGVQPNDYVAIISERSMEMLVGICGIVKSGAAYVPVDPHYPKDRIDYILADCRPKAVLIGNAEIDTAIAAIDLFTDDLSGESSENPVHVNAPGDSLYAIYTSGTTGRPKGVEQTHQTIVNLISYEIDTMGKDAFDRTLFCTNYGFDVSVQEYFSTLLTGGCGYLITDEEKKEVGSALYAIEQHHVRTILTTPSYFNVLCENGFETVCENLENVILAGEAFQVNERIIKDEKAKALHLYNHYGPTETHVVTVNECLAGDMTETVMGIGRPVANTQIYIVQNGRLCGVGIPGELWAGGVQVAKGYLGNETLTAAKFIANPFGEGRVYKTGDLARWKEDGSIEYLGRIDEQVKIRGYRIELGEIESVIKQSEAVTDAAVIAGEASNGDKLIIAYIVSPHHVDIGSLREEIRRKLPEYMVPAGIMQIDAIPLTSNGKVNRRALPKVEAETGGNYSAPRTPLEKKVAEAFAKIVGAAKVGRNDSFFEIGGHSLRAVKLVNMLEEISGIRLKVKDILKLKTVENICRAIDGGSADTYESIPSAEPKDAYIASPVQRRIYLAAKQNEDSISYNIPIAYKAEKKLDVDKLRTAIKALVNRHEALRTEFFMQNGTIFQRIRDIDFEPEYEVISDGTQTDREITDAFIRPFDLSTAPLFRAKIVDRGDYQLLLFDMHHIISDGGTNYILTGDLIRLYKGEELPPLAKQYKDYSEWISQKDISAQKEYWLRRFEDEIPVLDLPTDRPREKEQTYSGDIMSRYTDAELKRDLKRTANELGTTEYVLMLSAFMIQLSRYSRQNDIVVGTLFAGRNHRELENIAGMFVNTVALRGTPTADKTVRSFVQEVQKTFLDAEENQDYQFDELVDALHIPRNSTRNPLFDVMFVLQNNESSLDKLQEAGLTELEARHDVSKFDISLNIFQTADGYMIGAEYNNILYRPYFIETFLKSYEQILRQLIRKLDAPLAAIEIVTEEEKQRILHDFNDTASDYPKDKGVHELFAEQVRIHPDKPAVIACDRTLTYSQLDEASNRVANALLSRGIGKGDIVAFMLPRNSGLIAVMLGILKAGSCYIPLDPDYPKDRIDFMLEDSGAAFMVNEENIAELCGFRDASSPAVAAAGDDLCYCIYTSGSTGKPKGTLLTHRNAVNYISPGAHNIMGGIIPPDSGCVLSVTTVGFDIFVTESLLTLCNGLTMLFADETQSKIQSALNELASAHHAEVMQTTPTKMRLLIDSPIHREYLDHLKVIMLGGEPLDGDLVRRLRGMTKAGIFNVYGPTETTVWSSFAQITNSGAITVGKPIANTQIYIVDDRISPVPIGVSGELCIAGDGVCAGYLHRPELTAEKFIRNPFGEGRLYRTGDLARWLSDGNIECLGRMDSQVKIRGQRIELGEIEQTIRRQQGIVDVAVIVAPDDNGDNAIFAYFVSDERIDVSQLRSEIRRVLPGYMVPAGFMRMERLPLMPNGKLNRRALPKIDAAAEESIDEPVNDLQQYVLNVWKRILDKQGIGIKSNFFDVGGNSLNMLTVIGELKEKGYQIKVMDMQGHPTVESLCNEVLSKQDVALDSGDTEEFVIEKYDNMINSIITYHDDLLWDEYDCFFRPVSIIAEAIAKDYFDIVTMENSFYTLYGIDGIFGVNYASEIFKIEDCFRAFFNQVIQNKLKIRMEKWEYSSAKEMHSMIKDAIDNGYPVLVPVETYRLIYSAHYETDTSIHYMIVKGYDSKKKRYMLLDNLQLDNGSGTVYKDFYISYDYLHKIASFHDENFEKDESDYVYVFRNTVRTGEMHYQASEALADHFRLLAEMENGIVQYYYLEEEAVNSVYELETAIRDNAVVNDGEIVDPELRRIFSIFKTYIKEYAKSRVQDIVPQILTFKATGFEKCLNMKSAYFKTLNNLLKKCGIDGERMDGIRQCESEILEAWNRVKQYRLMLASQEDVERSEVTSAIDSAKVLESRLRRILMACENQIRTTDAADEEKWKAQTEAAARGCYLDNVNNAKVDFNGDDIRMELFPDKPYSLWLYDDTAPKVGKAVISDNWEVSTTVMTNYPPDESHFNDGFVIHLENGSKFLFGVLRENSGAHYVRLLCPELKNDYELFVNFDQLDPASVVIRVMKEADKLHFDYRKDKESDWIRAKTVTYKGKVKSVAIMSRNWENIHHIASFKDVKFSW